MAASKAALERDMTEMYKAYQDAYSRRDFAALSALYTEDALLLPFDEPPVKGRQAIKAMQEAQSAKVPHVRFIDIVDCFMAGDMAVCCGHTEALAAEGKIMGEFNDMVVCKKVGGKWLFHRDIQNTRTPLTN